MTNIIQVKQGLRELPPDSRDFKLGQIIKLPKLEELPEEFELKPITVKNQKDDYCTAAMTCGMSELQEKVPLSHEWSMAVSKMISGDPDQWGQNLRDACMAHIKFGAVEEKDIPDELKTKNATWLRYIQNYPIELFEKAKEHKKQSVFDVDGPYDAFDNIRAAIYLFRNENRAVGLGVEWKWDLDEPVIRELPGNGEGHAIYAIGWIKRGHETNLVLQNSYGKDVGDNGKFYFPREEINPYAEKYGIKMFVDMPTDEAKKICWSYQRQLYERIKKIIKIILKK